MAELLGVIRTFDLISAISITTKIHNSIFWGKANICNSTTISITLFEGAKNAVIILTVYSQCFHHQFRS